MRRWLNRMMCAAVLSGALPTGLLAQPKTAPAPVAADPYRAATPYNATIMNRTAPNSANNMPNYTLPCEIANMNTDAYVPPPCDWGCGGKGGCGNGCDSGCGSLLGRHSWGGCGNGCGNACDSGCGGLFDRFRGFGCGNSCNTCDRGRLFDGLNWGCGKSCGNSCDSGCGGLFDRFRGFGCNSGCGHDRWARWSVGCNSGCSTGCNTGCNGCAPAATAPATLPAEAPKAMPKADAKPMSYLEPVGFFTREKKASPVDDCQSCPPNGPKPKHTSKGPTTLGCASCSSWQSEYVFLFGSCRQFFGEPTHAWLHGK